MYLDASELIEVINTSSNFVTAFKAKNCSITASVEKQKFEIALPIA